MTRLARILAVVIKPMQEKDRGLGEPNENSINALEYNEDEATCR